MRVWWTSSRRSKCWERNGQQWCKQRWESRASVLQQFVLLNCWTFGELNKEWMVMLMPLCFSLYRTSTSFAIRRLWSTLEVLITMQRKKPFLFPPAPQTPLPPTASWAIKKTCLKTWNDDNYTQFIRFFQRSVFLQPIKIPNWTSNTGEAQTDPEPFYIPSSRWRNQPFWLRL